MFLFCCSVYFAEHPEDKQLPVYPATGHPSSVCYHPQFTPPGPGILRHAHHLQPCWWVWPRSLPFKAKNSLLGRVTVCAARRCFLLSCSQWYRYRSRNVSSHSVWPCFVLAEFSLSSAEISSLQGFSSPGLSLGSMSAWQQHQLGQAALNSLVWVTHFQTKAHSPDALTWKQHPLCSLISRWITYLHILTFFFFSFFYPPPHMLAPHIRYLVYWTARANAMFVVSAVAEVTYLRAPTSQSTPATT